MPPADEPPRSETWINVPVKNRTRPAMKSPIEGRTAEAATAALPPRRLLWLVTAAFALSGFALSAVLSQMVPMLTALGLVAARITVINQGIQVDVGKGEVLHASGEHDHAAEADGGRRRSRATFNIQH